MRFLPFLFAMATASLGDEVENQRHRAMNEEDDCGRNSAFTAFALVEHEMGDPYDLNYSEIRTITEGFQSTYNTLNLNGKSESAACDNIVKRYSHVPVMDAKDVFYDGIGPRSARRNFLYSVTVSGVDVDNNSRLFDFADEETDGRELFVNSFQVNPEILEKANEMGCNCPSKAESFETRAPTELEFKQEFNSFIRSEEKKGKLNNLGRILHVTELEQVDCTPDTIYYETEVVVDLDKKVEVDVQEIGQNVMDTYNDYSSLFCDPCFNVVTRVEVEEQEVPEARRNLVETRLINRIRGKCRKKKKCKRRRKLFNDGLRRVLLPLVPVSSDGRYRRRLVDENACYCPTQPEATGRSPTTLEFLDALNPIIKASSDAVVLAVEEE